jgi:predicted nucleotidyltransferase
MSQNATEAAVEGVSISVPIPAAEPSIYGKGATDSVLVFLSRHPFSSFSQRTLAEHVDYSVSAVRRAVDVLAANDLVERDQSGNRNLVGINRQRLSVPDDPILQIPQAEFQQPVRAAVESLTGALTDVIGIVLYGSVARGTADRRSDIDLWVIVRSDRAANQRRASEVETELGTERFDGERYAFHIAVEAVGTVPSFTDDISAIVQTGIPVYTTEDFDTLRTMLARGQFDE